ncbi:multiheme c-type cytochrome [Candidatus Entotheonella palauensis]|uniref:Cytochrome c-552/4 domain-containing protein n=1 Tax=Candidatus Entotheonella gemina TaxID=1429439 RepID=W4MGD9_9BACT|nr:multiheme c-type cytochrome [Candidatus Entotheonella palauensis]ETX08996.1 MAG: hypothetical protein ETSY2_02070 [Candidatus Entotheonella gemina]
MYHILGCQATRWILAFLICSLMVSCRQTPNKAVAENDAIASFVAKHWQFPVPPQGEPPADYSPLEASLDPQQCGICHPQQYQDWQTTLHSHAMSPGIYGQMVEMADSDPATYTICASCHTPLSEQLPFLETDGSYRNNPDFDVKLQQAGLICAGCHVRQHQRFGPPRRAELPPIPPGTKLPHGGFTVRAAYEDSAFCSPCHQFKSTDFALNGTLLQNTYEEWRQSRYAKEGIHCQNCHMPNRRHLWRGIHDPGMVKQAMTVALSPDAASYAAGDKMTLQIMVTNSGAGHYFPTYVTPKIFVQAHLLDAQGNMLGDTAQEAVIGRDVTLDLSTETYDTRIAPDASRTITYIQDIPSGATTLRVRIVVHPDHFYRQFFAAVLADGEAGKGQALLQEALRRAESSPFTVFEREIALKKARG